MKTVYDEIHDFDIFLSQILSSDTLFTDSTPLLWERRKYEFDPEFILSALFGSFGISDSPSMIKHYRILGAKIAVVDALIEQTFFTASKENEYELPETPVLTSLCGVPGIHCKNQNKAFDSGLPFAHITLSRCLVKYYRMNSK